MKQPVHSTSVSPAAALNFSAARILIIDDNALARDILDYALGELSVGHIFTADNASDALAKLPEIAPDLILVDWEMQPISGIDFVRQIRSDTSRMLRYVPIIMVTGYSEQWRVQLARDAGVTEFVVKPYSAKTLFSKIRTTVESPRSFVEVPGGYFGPDRRRRKMPVGEDRRSL